MRRGRRVGTPNAVLHLFDRHTEEPARFGFVVSKAVGGAVTRNLVRRRLREICRDVLPSIPQGTDVVIRALPGSDAAGWDTLHREIAEGLGRGSAQQ